MRAALLGTVLVAMACASPSHPTPPPPATYSVSPTALWAGTPLTLTSEAFRDLGDGALLRLGTTDYPLERVNPTTLSVEVPSSAGGIYDPVVVMGDSLVLVDQITVWGFAATRRYGPESVWLPWDVYVWPEGSTSILAGTTTNSLVTIDLDTEEVITFPGLLATHVLRGPGATYQDSVFILRSAGQAPSSWKLTEQPELFGEHPEFVSTRQVMRLGVHTWILTYSNRVETWTRADSSEAYTVTSIAMNESQGVHLSPRKDRATIRAADVPASVAGVPVFVAPSGALAYYVALGSSHAVDWSTDGSLLAMAGLPLSGEENSGQVYLLNATTGATLGSALTQRPVFGVAIDERRPYLYVGITSASGRLAVQVYQRPALTLVAELDVPDSDATCGLLSDCFGGVLAVGLDAVHVFYGWNGPTRSSRFFLPPP